MIAKNDLCVSSFRCLEQTEYVEIIRCFCRVEDDSHGSLKKNFPNCCNSMCLLWSIIHCGWSRPAVSDLPPQDHNSCFVMLHFNVEDQLRAFIMEIFIHIPLMLCTLYLFISFSPTVIASRRPWTAENKRCSIPNFTHLKPQIIYYLDRDDLIRSHTISIRRKNMMIIDVSGASVGQGGPEL